MKTKFLRVGTGEVVEFLTLVQLAKLCNRKSGTLRKWEQKNWLPKANFHMPDVLLPRVGKTIPGARVYSKKYAEQMAEVIKEVKQGIEIEHDVIHKLFVIMKEEKIEYSPKT